MRAVTFFRVVMVVVGLAGVGAAPAIGAESTSGAAAVVARDAGATPASCVRPYGVPLAPPIYLINFLLLYFSNPAVASYMPAYGAAVPDPVYDCLLDNPEGCPLADMARYFRNDRPDTGRKALTWPASCQTDPRLARLSAPDATRENEINQPLGRPKADRLARELGITPDMILTDAEYQCMIGSPPRDDARQIIYVCSHDLTNSRGNAAFPLSSYGLSLSADGDVRSNCAPNAPCLEFNKLFAGPLELIAKQCGFETKLARLVQGTPFFEFVDEGNDCQKAWEPVCIAERTRPGGHSPRACNAP